MRLVEDGSHVINLLPPDTSLYPRPNLLEVSRFVQPNNINTVRAGTLKSCMGMYPIRSLRLASNHFLRWQKTSSWAVREGQRHDAGYLLKVAQPENSIQFLEQTSRASVSYWVNQWPDIQSATEDEHEA